MANAINDPHSLPCALCEPLMAEAHEGLLEAPQQARLEAHLESCASCAALYEEAGSGREWLQFLTSDPEVPGRLAEAILARSGPGRLTAPPRIALPPHTLPARRWGAPAQLRTLFEPRRMMAVATAVFSIALTLQMTGAPLGGLQSGDLSLERLRGVAERRLAVASTPLVRYYDNLRVVRELEATVRELGGEVIAAPQEPEAPGRSSWRPAEMLQRPGAASGGEMAPALAGYARVDLRERNPAWIA